MNYLRVTEILLHGTKSYINKTGFTHHNCSIDKGYILINKIIFTRIRLFQNQNLDGNECIMEFALNGSEIKCIQRIQGI